MELFTRQVIEVIKAIPEGKVSTYGAVAFLAGRANGARQVSRILHTMSRKYDLPWFRIINSKGFISLPELGGYEKQKNLLLAEGVEFDENDRIDLEKYLWQGPTD